MIDYRQLLLKYIHHVGVEEGVTFIDHIESCPELYPQFSQEEIGELVELDLESMKHD